MKFLLPWDDEEIVGVFVKVYLNRSDRIIRGFLLHPQKN